MKSAEGCPHNCARDRYRRPRPGISRSRDLRDSVTPAKTGGIEPDRQCRTRQRHDLRDVYFVLQFQKMKELNTILREATCAIEAAYFRLSIAGGPSVYRERVYCYELYHQMRQRWPKRGCEFSLNGEVDKRAHPILGELGLSGIPDFLVHGPGDMNKNHAIIEVKSPLARDAQIETDLIKLARFVNDAGYQRAIYLIYGTEADQLIERILRTARSIASRAPVELWLHQQIGQPAECVEPAIPHSNFSCLGERGE